MPDEYKWSSYGYNAWGDEGWLTNLEEYLLLGKDTESRCHNYRGLFCEQINDDDLLLIRKAAHYCQPVGDDRFRKAIENDYGIKLGQMSRGRPKNTKQ